MVVVEEDVACEVDVGLGILCVCDVKHLILSVVVFREVEYAGAQAE